MDSPGGQAGIEKKFIAYVQYHICPAFPAPCQCSHADIDTVHAGLCAMHDSSAAQLTEEQ